jgi:imidazole glycerol phosphate synthase glutamine amidotransferase subunit
MPDRAVSIVPTGTANLASVMAGLRRVGAEPVIATSPEELILAPRVVVPGVGSFGAALTAVRRRGMDVALRERLASGAPTLLICLGLQLLADASEESPGVAGLGVIAATVKRLPPHVRLPQLGWNRVTTAAGARFLTAGYAYFANSYCLYDADGSWTPAWSDHGGPFIAGLERGAQLACQFHPELSGAWGLRLLDAWCNRC